MHEKKNSPFEDDLKALITRGCVVDQTDTTPIPANVGATSGRLANSCASAWIGGKTWAGPEAHWNYPRIIVAGPIGKGALPELTKDRGFARMPGKMYDYLVTWEDS